MRDRYTGRFFDDDMEGEPRRRYDDGRYDEGRHYEEGRRYAEQRRFDEPRRLEEPRRFEEPHWRRDLAMRGHELDRDYGRGWEHEHMSRDDRWRPDRDRDRWTEGRAAPYGMARPRNIEEASYGRTWMDEGRVELGPRHPESFVPRRAEPPRRYPRGPKGYRRSDERVKEDVCDRLYHSHDLDSSDVEVRVQNGEVILTGTVPDRSMKYRIESTIEDVSGVVDVTNQIRVRQAQYGREWNEQHASDGTPENGRRHAANMPRS